MACSAAENRAQDPVRTESFGCEAEPVLHVRYEDHAEGRNTHAQEYMRACVHLICRKAASCSSCTFRFVSTVRGFSLCHDRRRAAQNAQSPSTQRRAGHSHVSHRQQTTTMEKLRRMGQKG